MVEIDRGRCGFYGGCVSVCPVGAIELAEKGAPLWLKGVR